MLPIDYHVHSSYSDDSCTPLVDMVRKAAELGLTEIAMTEHKDFLTNGKPYPYSADFDSYFLECKKLSDQYNIQIIIGVEIGVEPCLQAEILEFTNRYPFEFIIGSSHDSHNLSLYAGDYFIGKDKITAYTQYFAEIIENVKKISPMNVYGHLDFISRYGKYEDNSIQYSDYRDVIDEVLKTIIYEGKGIEINTSGFTYGINQTYPQFDILKKYKELGGEIVTIGSDSHNPSTIHSHFDIAETMLCEAGFKAYTVFRNRKPVFVDL